MSFTTSLTGERSRTVKVARTIADLGGSATITTNLAEEIRSAASSA